jgi:hypothetical protein
MSGYSTKAAGVRQKILGGSLQSNPPEEDGKNSQTLMGRDWGRCFAIWRTISASDPK